MVDLATLCASMDSDGSGSLSLEEMLDGFNNSEAFQKLMQYMDAWNVSDVTGKVLWEWIQMSEKCRGGWILMR